MNDRVTSFHALSASRAFTVPDLLAVLSLLLLLALVLVPAFPRTGKLSDATVCLSNQRQLTVAWQLYASDNQGKIVHNMHGSDATGGAAAVAGRFSPWASGWLDWANSSDNTNILFIRDARYAKLAPYITTSRNIHKCPADSYLSTAQRKKGWHQRIRSVAMNGTLGNANYAANPGPWDPATYAIALSLGDLLYPGPSETFLFVDEHPQSINDPFFFPPIRNWVDFPASFHQGAGGLSFADGHVELHAWLGDLRKLAVTVTGLPSTPVGDPRDITWISYRCNRKGAKTY